MIFAAKAHDRPGYSDRRGYASGAARAILRDFNLETAWRAKSNQANTRT